MTKSDLINRMCEVCSLPTARAEQLVNAIFGAIEQSLNRGERVEIRGFGSFEVRDYRGYVGRNPRTGTTVEVKPKRLAFFKVGKELKDRVQDAGVRARATSDRGRADAVTVGPALRAGTPAVGARVAGQPGLPGPTHAGLRSPTV